MNNKPMKMIQRFLPVLLCVLLSVAGCTNQGSKGPTFDVTTLEGVKLSSADLEGQVIVLNIWATWCRPCVEELPQLNELVEKYKDNKAVTFIAMSDESADKVQRLLSKRPFNYQQVVDVENIVNQFHPGLVHTIPLHVIIDASGMISFEMTGTQENIVELLSNEIEKAI